MLLIFRHQKSQCPTGTENLQQPPPEPVELPLAMQRGAVFPALLRGAPSEQDAHVALPARQSWLLPLETTYGEKLPNA